MRRALISCGLAAVVLCLQASRSEASLILGSVAFGTSKVTLIGGTTLASATSLKIDSFAGANGGQAIPQNDYAGTGPGPLWAGIPFGTQFSLPNLVLASLPGFTVSNAAFGTFTAVASQGIFTTQILNQSASFLDIFMIGNFVPTGAFAAAGYTSTETQLRLSFNQSGDAVSAAITLNSTPLPPQDVVPEPGTFLAALLGVAPLWVLRRRRNARLA